MSSTPVGQICVCVVIQDEGDSLGLGDSRRNEVWLEQTFRSDIEVRFI